MTTTTQRLVNYYQWVIENGGEYFNTTGLLASLFTYLSTIQTHLPTFLFTYLAVCFPSLLIWSSFFFPFCLILDPKTEEWPMIATPWPTISLVAFYLFIVKVGPKVMENRKAYNLREVLIVYNLALVALSAWMVYEVSAAVCCLSFVPAAFFRRSFLGSSCNLPYFVGKENCVTTPLSVCVRGFVG